MHCGQWRRRDGKHGHTSKTRLECPYDLATAVLVNSYKVFLYHVHSITRSSQNLAAAQVPIDGGLGGCAAQCDATRP